MPNQQLLNYIQAQIKNGVRLEAIKQALIKAGWPETEIAAALSTADSTTSTPATASTKLDSIFPVQSPVAAVSEKMGIAAATTSSMPSAGTTSAMHTSFLVASVIAVVALLASNSYVYMQWRSVTADTTQSQATATASRAQIATLEQAAGQAKADILQLQTENQDLQNFVALVGPIAVQTPIAVKGLFESKGQSGAAASYTLTVRGATFTVKNAMNEKTQLIFKNMNGQTIDAVVMRLPGQTTIKILSLNGASIE